MLGFPAGTAVPMGYYDREKAQWIAADNGIVIKLVSESGGRAALDVTGDGVADSVAALGIDDAELRKLAELYDPGKSLWRAAINHFTPWDYNWPYGLPGRRRRPRPGRPGRRRPARRRPVQLARLDHPLREPGARRAVAGQRHAVHARLPVRPRPRPPHRRHAQIPLTERDAAAVRSSAST